MSLNRPGVIAATWPVAVNVKAYTTLRTGGVSLPPYESFNLAEHVGDDPAKVQKNRELLKQVLNLPVDPVWLQQVHSKRVVNISNVNAPIEADGSYTNKAETVCAVMTADCLPVLLCNRRSDQVAAVHAGWKGLAAGVIEAAIEHFTCEPDEILAWLGPAIGPEVFEVGEEVRDAFLAFDPLGAKAFKPGNQGKWYADLYHLARLRLANRGVRDVYGGGFCTYRDDQRFYSYRRDHVTGRMASLIWLEQD